MTVRKNPQENREQLQKFPLHLKFLYATWHGPCYGTLKYDHSHESSTATLTEMNEMIAVW